MRTFLLAVVGYFAILAPFAAAQPAGESIGKFAAVSAGLSARNIGPANMGGRIVDLAVVESNPSIYYFASANGGVFKTSDAGKSWKPVFDQQDTLCIGSVAVCQAQPDVVYVGTGEGNPRNSVSWGKGVYRSVDGGKTWTHCGLGDTHHIGRVIVHPTDPQTAYVAALGHAWGPNADRGVFKTTDGGKTWSHSLRIDADTGVADLAADPSQPDVLYAAAYPVRRDGFSGGAPRSQWGMTGGIYKTTDGGKSWAKLSGGLPDRPIGRCGLAVYRKNPNVVYAVVQTDRTDGPTDNRGQVNRTSGLDVDKGGIFRSDDQGRTWRKLNDLVPRPFYYGQIRIDPTDDQRIYVLGIAFHVSSDGGLSFTAPKLPIHADQHALWINPKDPNHLILGNDGGLYVSRDRAVGFTADRGFVISQFYGVAVDMRTPYRVYGGLQDNGSWGGPSAVRRADGITTADWFRVSGGDGFYCACDPTDPDTVYSESQYGRPLRVNLRAEKGAVGRSIRPVPAKDAPAYRFNWSSPLLLSAHDPKTLYYGGNHLFKSVDRGSTWKQLSGDLTRGSPGMISTGNTLTTIAESPIKPGLVYVGTDDGNVQMTRDDGKTWVNLSAHIPGVPNDRWISRLECSSAVEGTVFLAIDRHRNDDRKPYLYRSTDYGKTWESIVGDLPADSPVYVIRESSKNPRLWFVGTEHGLYVSVNGGKRWRRMENGIPGAVAVHDLVIHPRDRELVVGTHARGVFVIDVAPLEELTDRNIDEPVTLFAVKPAIAEPLRPAEGKVPVGYVAANPAFGSTIYYYRSDRAKGPARLSILDAGGKVVAELPAAEKVGFHTAVWNLRGSSIEKGLVPPGNYTARLQIGDVTKTTRITVTAGGSR